MFIGFILLVVGGEFIIRSSVALSLKLNLSKLVIGMTVVAFATSLPELIVSISAAINDSPSIAINNVIGSNIANIGLVLGLTCIIGNMYVEKSFYRIDWPVMFLFSIILYVIIARDKPQAQANPNAMKAANLTFRAGIRADPTSLLGPTLSSSVPLIPSE